MKRKQEKKKKKPLGAQCLLKRGVVGWGREVRVEGVQGYHLVRLSHRTPEDTPCNRWKTTSPAWSSNSLAAWSTVATVTSRALTQERPGFAPPAARLTSPQQDTNTRTTTTTTTRQAPFKLPPPPPPQPPPPPLEDNMKNCWLTQLRQSFKDFHLIGGGGGVPRYEAKGSNGEFLAPQTGQERIERDSAG
jgi:hypothetical protein